MRQRFKMVTWQLVFTKQALKDAKKIKTSGLKSKVEELFNVLQNDPFQNPPRFEKLVGDLTGAYSRRINIHHRLVYQVLDETKTVKIIRMWTHYE
jgi:toxin YoeB